VTAAIPRGANSAPEATSRFLTSSTTTLYLAVSPKERILSSRVRRVIAVGMLVLIIGSAVGFYSRESRTFHMAATGAQEMSHPPQ
jgi:hypothetical protein